MLSLAFAATSLFSTTGASADDLRTWGRAEEPRPSCATTTTDGVTADEASQVTAAFCESIQAEKVDGDLRLLIVSNEDGVTVIATRVDPTGSEYSSRLVAPTIETVLLRTRLLVTKLRPEIGPPSPLLAPVLPRPAPSRSQEATYESYGWQIAIVDAAALSLLVGAALSGRDKTDGSWRLTPAMGIGAGLYLAGAPAIHTAHGRPLMGLGSLGLRAAGPFGGALAGVLTMLPAALILGVVTSGYGANGARQLLDVGAIGGGIAGIVAPMVADAIAFARVKQPAISAEKTSERAPRIDPPLAKRSETTTPEPVPNKANKAAASEPLTRVAVRSPARVQLQRKERGSWVTACISPCDEDLSQSYVYRLVDDRGRPMDSFRLDSSKLTLEVSPRSTALDVVATVAGVSAVGFGFAGALTNGRGEEAAVPLLLVATACAATSLITVLANGSSVEVRRAGTRSQFREPPKPMPPNN